MYYRHRESAQKLKGCGSFHLTAIGRPRRSSIEGLGKTGRTPGYRVDMATDKIRLIPPLGISALSGIVVGVVTLLVINASLLRVPDVVQSAGPRAAQSPGAQPPTIAERDYKPLMERNLFRAKLQVEIPKPKTEKEIEEEALTAAVKGMALKGVMMGTEEGYLRGYRSGRPEWRVDVRNGRGRREGAGPQGDTKRFGFTRKRGFRRDSEALFSRLSADSRHAYCRTG